MGWPLRRRRLPSRYAGHQAIRDRGRASYPLVGRRCLTLPTRRRPDLRSAGSFVSAAAARSPFWDRPPPMTREEIARPFVDFFHDRGHQRVTGSTLLPPPGDPVLFTTSGMHPLTPYLEGRRHPQGRRLVGVQRCLRTSDLDEVGDDTHLTVFEMLGSWSLGDYDHSQSLRWGLELLRDGFGLSPDRLHVTVFGGDSRLGVDQRSLDTWRELGVPVELLGDDNWWSNGPTGLCGPDSEIFVWTGSGPPTRTPGTDDRWVEVWNHVGMRYDRRPDGSLVPLSRPNVDTGLGL